jgi:hypothetical protein
MAEDIADPAGATARATARIAEARAQSAARNAAAAVEARRARRRRLVRHPIVETRSRIVRWVWDRWGDET